MDMNTQHPGAANTTTSVTGSKNNKEPRLVTIEWHMLDKRKFFPLSMTSSFTIRCFLHPLNVIKTRIQVQKHNSTYSGTVDAFWKIWLSEGGAGLYRGFWISMPQLLSGMAYMASYESVREVMFTEGGITDSRVRALCGGAVASLVSQTIIVPFDIISQHMMVIGQKHGHSVLNPLNIDYQYASNKEVATRLVRAVYAHSGLLGFYRGYTASLLTYVPNSAMWWSLYHTYQDCLSLLLPASVPALAMQGLSASLGGATTAVISNPFDILRARLQVCTNESNSIAGTMRQLWQEERLKIFTKGLSARLIQTIVYSSVIISGYETVKRLAVRDEYKHMVRW
uniref:Solute carrier family 25 member 44-like n=1 Tax=Hirondellea gigas TaxID=1518452 RepID=A0A2P2I5L7_9CRUS